MTRVACLLAAVTALGCHSPRTEVVVVVDTAGLVVPRDLDALHITVADKALTGDSATLFDSQTAPICRSDLTGGCYDFPVTLTLVPGDHRPDDPVRVHVQALLGTQAVIDDAATFTFIQGTSARLDFILFPACLDTDCAASDRVCGSDGQCTIISPQPFQGEPDLSATPHPDGGGDFDLSIATAPDLRPPPPDLSTMLVCDGGVADITKDPQNCGGCGMVCPNPTPAPNTAAICNNKVCGIGCQPGWGDCDGLGINGCEHDVTGDTANCGQCGHVCGNANTVGGLAVCTSGACVFNCSPGTMHCSASDATGCETTIATDAHNCGSCGFDCGSAACVNGFCRYTNGGEGIQTQNALSVLVQDSASLYWFGDTCSSIHVIRRVNKDGTGLADVWAASKIGCPDQGAALAVDKNYLYFFNDTYKGMVTKGVKSGVQDPMLIINTGAASGTGIYVDTDDSANAKYVFMTQASNAPGLYRIDLANPVWSNIYASDARGMTRTGNTLFFGALATNGIQYIDMYAASPSPKSLTTLPMAPRGLITDGVNVYAGCDDSNLYAISIATGGSTKIASAGPGSDAVLATDGAYVYVAGSGNVYRVPVNGNGTYASYKWVTGASLPGGGSPIAIQVDANALYFATFADVFKTRK